MKILFVGSEATPFAKTGGLADVLGSLPKAIATLGHEVSVVLPKHLKIKRVFQDLLTTRIVYYIDVHDRKEYVGIECLKQDGLTYYFIDNEYYFGYRENLYGDYDDGERYGYFNQAVALMFAHLKYYPDIIHLNDWQSGLIPLNVRYHYPKTSPIHKTKYVITIHNLAYQGVYPKTLLPYLNLPHDENIIYNDQINFLKSALVSVDAITTVSKTYAEEILTPAYGEGLDPLLLLNKNKLYGIMNGLDYQEYNPSTDALIAKGYSKKTLKIQKAANKHALLRMFHLSSDPSLPLIGMVSRLTEAKGFPLIEGIIEPYLKEKKCIFVLLGSGDRAIESVFTRFKQKYPNTVGIYFGYSDTIARQIYAGADFFMMPSRFEPCGLAQLISMHYGTLPIVRATGGLKDSVIGYEQHPQTATGFSFDAYQLEDLQKSFDAALKVYRDETRFIAMRKRAMDVLYDWQKSAQTYEELYKKLQEE